MRLVELADSLERLEETRSRQSMVERVAELLTRSARDERASIVDVVLVGYLRGRGKRASLGIGSLVGAVYDQTHDRFRTVAKIGSGLSDAAWKQLRSRLDEDATPRKPARVDSLLTPDVWIEPRYVVEVLADEITRSPFHTCGKSGRAPGYALRFPRLVGGVRADKAATDATTQREIIEMYKQQRKT
jgi:DNA ligase-1